MVIDKKNRTYRELKKNRHVPPGDPLTGLSPAEDVKAAHSKNHATPLSTGIKANHPRLRDGCSTQRCDVNLAAVVEWSRYLIVAGLSRARGGCGSPVVKVSNHGRHVMSSIPVPLKTRRVGQRCTLNLSRAETSSRWCGVVVRRGGASSGVVHVT
ncbi:uncharacterized protein TNCV_4154961 [Trichonephila clavipes]|nr:uncharacterized protein TNCV_4154961 [Trichonephila clavipes]